MCFNFFGWSRFPGKAVGVRVGGKAAPVEAAAPAKVGNFFFLM